MDSTERGETRRCAAPLAERLDRCGEDAVKEKKASDAEELDSVGSMATRLPQRAGRQRLQPLRSLSVRLCVPLVQVKRS